MGRPRRPRACSTSSPTKRAAACCACSSSTSGPTSSATASDDYLDHPRLRQHRDADLWDALEAASGEPVRAIMDTWILQGGYPLVAGGRRRIPHPGARSPTGAQPGGAIGSTWLVPVLTRSLGATPRSTRRPSCCRDAVLGRSGGRSGGHRPWSTPAARGTTGSPTRRPWSNGWPDGWASSAPSSATTWSRDTWAAALAGPGSARPTSCAWPAPWPTRPRATRASGRWSPAPSGCSTGSSPTPTDPSWPRSSGPCSVRWPATWAGIPADGDDERTPTLRASVLAHPRHRRRATARSGPRPPGASPTRGEHRCTPTPRRPSWTSWPPTAASREFDAFLERYRAPTNPQEENRYLYALASFRRRRAGRPDLRSGHDRGPDPERPVPAPAAAGQPGHRAGHMATVTEEWDELVARFPSNILPRMLDGVRGPVRSTGAGRRGHRLRRTHPLPAGGRTVDQILERWPSTWPSVSARGSSWPTPCPGRSGYRRHSAGSVAGRSGRPGCPRAP